MTNCTMALSDPLSIRFPLEVLQSSSSKLKSAKEKISHCASKVLNTAYPRNPVTKQREFMRLIPYSLDILIGKYLFSSMISAEGGHYNKHTYEETLNKIGTKLIKVCDRPELPFKAAVIDSTQVNAWCLPGAKIGFYKGLIERMAIQEDTYGVGAFTLEEKIAAVMGHEITHAAARHGARSMELGCLIAAISVICEYAFTFFLSLKLEDKQIGNSSRTRDQLIQVVNFVFSRINLLLTKLIILNMSRSKELEADKYGMVYMKRAGYNPEAAIWLQEFFAHEDPKTDYKWIDRLIQLFSSHPASEERAEANRKTLKEINAKILV